MSAAGNVSAPVGVPVAAVAESSALHSLDSYDVLYDGQEHDDTKSISHLDWPFLIKVRTQTLTVFL